MTTRDGVARFDAGRFERLGVAAGLPAGEWSGLAFAADGALLLSGSHGLVRLRQGRAEKLPPPPGRAELGAIAVAVAPDGALWAASGEGMIEHRGGTTRLHTARDGLPADYVTAVLVDRAGRVWAGTSLGLAVAEGGRFVVPSALAPLAGRWVRSLLEDRDGNLWIGLRSGGIFRARDGQLAHLGATDGLPSEFIRQIFEDRDGNVWMATGDGLIRLADGPVRVWSRREGLPEQFVWSVLEDPAGDLWVGTNGGGIARLSAGGPSATGFDGAVLAGTEARAFLADRHGALWIGTSGSGLLRREGTRLIAVGPREGATSRWILSLLEDRRGEVWIGTGEGLWHWRDGRVQERYGVAQGLPQAAVRALAEGPDGTLWIGTGAGLARLASGRCERVDLGADLGALRIHGILPEADGVVWLATDGGLLRLTPGGGQRVGSDQGLPDEMVYSLVDDRAGNLWLGTDLGIVRLPKAQVEELVAGRRRRVAPLRLSRDDGLRSTECNSGQPGGVRRRDGTLCFATTNGVACVDPARLTALEDAPPVSVAELAVDGVPLPASDATEVPSGARRLDLRYAAIALSAHEKVGFRYRLQGFDAGWVDAGRERAAHFTRLRPGRYRFEVQARRGGGPWGEPGAALAFTVRPPFYQTAIFYLLVAGGLALVAGVGFRVRVRQLRLSERRLAALVEERTGALEETSRRLEERTRDLQRANAELERLSLLDGLTRIGNRRHFDARLEAEWRRAARAGTPLSLILADIDFFKPFNDDRGHLAGDDCLRAVAAALAAQVRRAEDFLARYGGEELAVLLPGADEAEAAQMAERLRRAVEELDLPHASSRVAARVTLSCGYATARPTPSGKPEDLVSAADGALYRAKAEGRNRVCG